MLTFHSHSPRPTAFLMILDAIFFPHIIEEILANTSPKVLRLSLRVSKAWRHLALQQLPYHAMVTNVAGSERIAVYGSKDCRSSSWEEKAVLNPACLAAVAVLDVDMPPTIKSITFKLHRCPPELTIRYYRRCDPDLLQLLERLQPSCLVLFGQDIRGYHDLSYFAPYRFGNLSRPKKLVLHLKEKGWSSLLQKRTFCLGSLTNLTLIVPWSLDVSQYFNAWQLGLLTDLVMLAYVDGVPVTIVNPNFPEQDADRGGGSIKDRFLARFSELKRYYEPRCRGGTALNVQCLTPDEYRAQVGDTQFQIETVEGPIARPALQAAT